MPIPIEHEALRVSTTHASVMPFPWIAKLGDKVQITAGAFKGMIGTIVEFQPGKVVVEETRK